MGGMEFSTYTFGMGNVKEESINMADNLFDTLSMLSLLGKLDPYWKSQLLVEYSKDLHTCMILDELLNDESYSILDGVIYNHGRIFLSKASNLKEKLLQRALLSDGKGMNLSFISLSFSFNHKSFVL